MNCARNSLGRLLGLLAFIPCAVHAAPPDASSAPPRAVCAPARKPNSELATAESVASQFCRSGQASDDSSRDLFRWSVAPGDSAHLWSLALEALSGQSARLEFFELLPGTNTQDIAKA